MGVVLSKRKGENFREETTRKGNVLEPHETEKILKDRASGIRANRVCASDLRVSNCEDTHSDRAKIAFAGFFCGAVFVIPNWGAATNLASVEMTYSS